MRLELALPGYSIWPRAWQGQLGRVRLYLLDSNDAANYRLKRAGGREGTSGIMNPAKPRNLTINGGSSSIKLHCSRPVTRADPQTSLLTEFCRAGVTAELPAAGLQREGTAALAKSWRDLISRIAAKSEVLERGMQMGATQ